MVLYTWIWSRTLDMVSHTHNPSPGEAEQRNLISKIILGYKARLSEKKNKEQTYYEI